MNTLLLTTLTPLLCLCAPDQGVRLPSTGVVPSGEALISELGCSNCHAPGDLPVQRLAARRAPNLERVGARRTARSLRELLESPHQARPGTSMPDLLASLSPKERAAAIEDLVHYLASRGGPMGDEPFEATEEMLAEGRQLLHEVGCVACHTPEESIDDLFEPFEDGASAASTSADPVDEERYVAPGTLDPPQVPFGDLAHQTSVRALRDFLLDPVAARPSGRMPAMGLTESEARDIAVYLLRDQFAAAGHGEAPGVRYAYYEGTFPGDDVALEGLEPTGRGVMHGEITLPEHREDFFAVAYVGRLVVTTPGEYRFETASDDGSWVYVDGELVVDNGGIHGVKTAEGTVQLEAGTHGVRILFYEHAGGSELRVRWSGPGFDERALRGDDLLHRTVSMRPPVSADFALDSVRVARGEALFQSLGCAACHEAPAPFAKPLADCDPSSERGCLAERGGARYGWSAAQAASVRGLLEQLDELAPPTDAEHARTLMARNRCFACHRRDEIGGPHPLRRTYFFEVEGFEVEGADLGEQGRIPPSLDLVGSKLQPGWLGEVLERGGSVRPYLLTRMPQFAAREMGELQAALLSADRLQHPPEAPPFTAEAMLAGRELVGTEGFGCIQCHTFKGYRSLGIPAVDLATVSDRIHYPWFRELLRDPKGIGMNTRMPEFWIDGQSPVRDVLGGDGLAQIDAVWTYLSLGNSMPLPAGLDVPDSAYELELGPGAAPRIVGVFMKGLSPRVVAVGTPEHVHYAFDVENSRLAKVWRGRFFNARGTWEGRAGQLELPPSDDVLELPEGPPFALLADPQEEWPRTQGRAPALRALGRRYDDERRPIFRYALGEIVIEETPVARMDTGRGALLRRFRLDAPGPVESLFFNTPDGPRAVTFQPLPGGGFRAEFEERISW